MKHLILIAVLALCGCGSSPSPCTSETGTHEWGKWATVGTNGVYMVIQQRECTICGLNEKDSHQ